MIQGEDPVSTDGPEVFVCRSIHTPFFPFCSIDPSKMVACDILEPPFLTYPGPLSFVNDLRLPS